MKQVSEMSLEELREEESNLTTPGLLTPENDERLRIVRNWISQRTLEVQTEEKKVEHIKQLDEKMDSDIPFHIAGLENLDKDLISLIELVVKADRRVMIEDHKAKVTEIHNEHAEDLKAADERENQLRSQVAELQQHITNAENNLNILATAHEELKADYELLEKEHDIWKDKYEKKAQEWLQEQMRANDNASKRDAAARELDEANKEIERLNGHIDDLRVQSVAGGNAHKVITLEESEQEKAKELISNISNKFGPTLEEKLKAQEERLAAKERGESTVFKIEAPVLGGQPAGGSFREEANDAEQQPTHEAVQNENAVDFRNMVEETQQAAGEVDSGDSGQAVGVDAEVTREEINIMKADIEAIKRRIGMNGAA